MPRAELEPRLSSREEGDLIMPTLVMVEVMAEWNEKVSVGAGLLWQRHLKKPGDDLTFFQREVIYFQLKNCSPPPQRN